MILDKAEISDIPGILALEEKCFSRPYSASLLEASLNDPLVFVMVARENGQTAGYAEFGSFIDAVCVNRIATDPGMRRRGIASLLLREGERITKELGISAMFLEVRSRNAAAAALYEKHGFIRTGTRRGYYKQPSDDALIYSKTILT